MIGSKHTLCLYICVWFNCVMIYMLYWRITIEFCLVIFVYQKSWQWWPIHFRFFFFEEGRISFSFVSIFVFIPQSFYVYILMKWAKSTIGICSFLLQSQFCGVHDQDLVIPNISQPLFKRFWYMYSVFQIILIVCKRIHILQASD